MTYIKWANCNKGWMITAIFFGVVGYFLFRTMRVWFVRTDNHRYRFHPSTDHPYPDWSEVFVFTLARILIFVACVIFPVLGYVMSLIAFIAVMAEMDKNTDFFTTAVIIDPRQWYSKLTQLLKKTDEKQNPSPEN